MSAASSTRTQPPYACQFTFTCDGVPDVVTEPTPGRVPSTSRDDMLDGKLWMPEVAKATHYHAFWVHPDWINEMTTIYKLGVHTFYRPRAWGDGADEPTWGDAKADGKRSRSSTSEEWPVSHSREWLRSRRRARISAREERAQLALVARPAMRGANGWDQYYLFSRLGAPWVLYARALNDELRAGTSQNGSSDQRRVARPWRAPGARPW